MKIYKIAIIAMMALIYQNGYGQVTIDDNVPALGNYVGFDINSGIALPIENRGFPEIDITSNGQNKFAISELPTWNGLGGLTRTDVQRTTMGLTGQDPLAWSMLHLFDDNAGALPATMQRDWMNVGVSHTENADFMYSGLLERPTGTGLRTDAVIAWGCQDGPTTADNFRFIFLQGNQNGADQGRELMRIEPRGNVGIGRVFSNTQQPQNRLEVHDDDGSPQLRITNSYNNLFTEIQESPDGNLHIAPQGGAVNAVAIGFLDGAQPDPIVIAGTPTTLDVGGLTRIRNLSDLGDNDCLVIGLQALSGAPEDNFLKRLDFTGDNTDFLAGDGTWQPGGSGADLDWESNGTDVWTGHGLNGFPAGDVFVGSAPFATNGKFIISDEAIGNSRAGARIIVDNNGSGSGTTRGLDVLIADNTDGGFNAGVDVLVRGGKFAVGGRFNANVFNNQSEWSAGVAGYCSGTINSPDVDVIGVYGYAENSAVQTVTRPIGVYGEAIFAGSIPTIQIAGHFQGIVQQLQPPIILSDASLKQNIETIENADGILSELNPVKYNYDMMDAFGIDAGESISHGFLAQELQSSFPDAVEDFYVPERRDTAGVVTRERSMHLGVKYNEFIALLVKGHQEQNALITDQAAMLTEQEEENANLQAQLAELSQQLTSQAGQMVEMQEQMTTVMASFQSTQSKMNNCCGTTPSEKGNSETGAIELEQNFPNPFEDVTTINFSINEPAQIRLEISDSQGRVMDVVVNQRMEKGEYTERWDGSAVAPGTYYYSLYADTELLTKKMIKR
jgi:hypothetical protein